MENFKIQENTNRNLMEKIVALAKRRGFIFPGSEIYGGLAGTWDYGPLGVELKNNIRNSWWKKFIQERTDIYGLDSAILMNAKVWEASGHVESFIDPMIDCRNCKSRFRADYLGQGKYGEFKTIEGKPICPVCGQAQLTEERPFNLMFKTWVGPVENLATLTYLRPEHAQGMFVDFKKIVDTYHPKIPFGIAQTGRVFRNEITPGDFTFRSREFDLMEFEYFVRPKEWKKYFDYWLKEIEKWLDFLGLDRKKIHYQEIPEKERAHYSKRTVDIEYQFPFGQKELCAISYRTDYDLKNHSQKSGQNLSYFDPETKKSFLPHVIEPTFGLDRAFLALLVEGYSEEKTKNGQKRVILKIPPFLAPYKVAVFPLLANRPALLKKARQVFEMLRPKFPTAWDDRGNIGKRYFSQDEIGTPYTLTIDFQTLKDETLTIRNRDTMEQERVKISDLIPLLREKLES